MANDNEFQKNLINDTLNCMPKVKVFLKRLVKRHPNSPVDVQCGVFKGKWFIYDMFANKYYTYRHYGKKWAFKEEELK